MRGSRLVINCLTATHIDGSGALAAGFAAVVEGGVTATRIAYLCSACQFEQRPQLPRSERGGSLQITQRE